MRLELHNELPRFEWEQPSDGSSPTAVAFLRSVGERCLELARGIEEESEAARISLTQDL